MVCGETKLVVDVMTTMSGCGTLGVTLRTVGFFHYFLFSNFAESANRENCLVGMDDNL